MSFAERVSKFLPMTVAAEKPTKSVGLQLCLPRLLLVEGNPMGLVSLELTSLVVGGVASTRLLHALDELLTELTEHSLEEGDGELPGELCEATRLIRQHLASMAAASDLAHAEHEATHQHGKDPLH